MPSVGLVGLPNVGKSTLFNALTAGGQEVSNYPFTTIDPKVGVVPVPDPRLTALAEALEPEESTPSFIRFVDVAGLVEGASRGEGLGNQFLGNLRTVDAVAHVVRCFADPEVVHVAGSIDPVRDAGVIATELLLADLEILTRAVEKRQKEWRTHPREHAAEEKRLTTWKERLEAGERIAAAGDLTPEGETQARALGLLTARPLLYVANVSEDEPENDAVAALRALAAEEAQGGDPAPVVPVSARIEAELLELPPDERELFMSELGMERTGFERLVEESFRLLGLIRFYTVVSGKLRAWEVPRGTLAPQAAGKIHGDMEEGFIRARVASWKDLADHGGFAALQTLGKVSTQGKDYEVRDGDVVEVLFNA